MTGYRASYQTPKESILTRIMLIRKGIKPLTTKRSQRLREVSIMVGIAQLVSASDCGSEGPGFESLYSPFNGLSPSGKAQGFDPCITLVRIQLAQLDSKSNPK